MNKECDICNGLGSIQGTQCPCQIDKTTDEKVLDYLERAEKIVIKWDCVDSEYVTTDGIVEIAKLLQREDK
jgi:hypothetical protein